jgi:signal peptidase I
VSVADEQAIGDDEPQPAQPATTDDEEKAPAKPPPSGLRRTLEWAGLIAAALLVALGVRATLVQTFYIPSESMEPTLEVGDRILVNKLSYRLHDVHRGDVVVFRRPPSAPSTPDGTDDLIKRVIALPGETIEAREDGRVYVDGDLLDEPYLPEGTRTDNLPLQTVPEGKVFVMGDNRDHSGDSRMFKAIDEDLIVGRAFVIIFPPGDAGGL